MLEAIGSQLAELWARTDRPRGRPRPQTRRIHRKSPRSRQCIQLQSRRPTGHRGRLQSFRPTSFSSHKARKSISLFLTFSILNNVLSSAVRASLGGCKDEPYAALGEDMSSINDSGGGPPGRSELEEDDSASKCFTVRRKDVNRSKYSSQQQRQGS